MIIHEMTWTELNEHDWQDAVVVIPLGATEQHGPHLPTDVDTRIIGELAQAVERQRREHIVLTPTIWLGHSPHHLSFGATLSISLRPYVEMVKAVCESYIGMGASKIWLLNGHGGNRTPLAVVLQDLKLAFPEVVVTASEYWSLARESIASLRESGPGGMGHACELETSLYLYLNGDGVRKNLIRDDGFSPNSLHSSLDMLQGESFSAVYNFCEISSSGVNGRPSLAAKEKGEQWYRMIVENLLDFADRLISLKRK
ncbi:creatininase family protein [Paenibacillus senegalensis]|uniref:creatininase family protein n=1 Tax=Paenibacillus senegalensis TaxID=1465766 RepID=UPI000289A183|nr:creatininase family protein [Paenibacillus senegalensis]